MYMNYEILNYFILNKCIYRIIMSRSRDLWINFVGLERLSCNNLINKCYFLFLYNFVIWYIWSTSPHRIWWNFGWIVKKENSLWLMHKVEPYSYTNFCSKYKIEIFNCYSQHYFIESDNKNKKIPTTLYVQFVTKLYQVFFRSYLKLNDPV